jgi:hypothetical protein
MLDYGAIRQADSDKIIKNRTAATETTPEILKLLG